MANDVVSQRTEKFKHILQSDNFRAEVAQALPAHIRPERFQRVLLTSVINDPRLLEVLPIKVVKAALKIAPLGLLADPLLGEAALVVDGKQDVQVRVMYRGLIKLAKQSGEIAMIYAHEVCKNDRRKISLGTEKRLEHEPAEGNRGEVVSYYAVVKYRTAEVDFEIMTVDEINAIRDRSDAYRAYKNGKIKSTPWGTDPGEMSKKTVLRRLLKRVPASPDLADALRLEAEADEKEFTGRVPHSPTPMVEEEPEYVELVDQHGEAFMVEPGGIAAWARERAGECASDEELSELAGNNPSRVEVGLAASLVKEERAAKDWYETNERIEDGEPADA